MIISNIKVKDAKNVEFGLEVTDLIELQCLDGKVIVTRIKGIEFVSPFDLERSLAFLLSPEVTQKDVSVGTEVWAKLWNYSYRGSQTCKV